ALEGSQFHDWIGSHMDVDLFLKTYAVNVGVGMWDDYWNNAGNNTFLYFNSQSATDYHVYLLPHDYDNTLGTTSAVGAQTDAVTHNPYEWGPTDVTQSPLVNKILAFDDYVPEDFGSLQADLARRDVRKATVLRDGDTLDIYIDQSMIGAVLNTPGMFELAIPFVIDTVMVSSPNAGAGLVHGDQILTLAGEEVPFVQDSRKILREHAGGRVPASILRGSDTLSMDLQVDSLGMIGVYTVMPGIERRSYTLAQAVPAGLKLTGSTIGGYLRDLKLVFTPRTEAYKSVGSFIAIGQVFPSAWDWYQFLNILAILSIMLGVMNLLPIPALDGGHIVFCLYEMLTGKKPSDRFMAVAQVIGMLLLLLLMMLAFGNDIGRLLR
ncbi:MAG: site-2 protease family protein, partial [Bacteroidales bacterium]|nr:site-2 protease family protein [Bacteroidales bacterium]